VLARYPSTGAVLLQHGRLFRTRPGDLYPNYAPALTIEEFATLNGISLPSLLVLLERAAEIDETDPRAGAAFETFGTPARFPLSGGELGYTGDSSQFADVDRDAVSAVTALNMRGPE
jgi:hypothetical protein